VIGNACMMTDGDLIDIADLPESLRAQPAEIQSADETLLPLDEIERRHVLRVLEKVGGNKVRAAEILHISRATIYQFLSRMKIAE